MYVRGYLQGSENDRVVTIAWYVYVKWPKWNEQKYFEILSYLVSDFVDR
jgi:hypothetical protein